MCSSPPARASKLQLAIEQPSTGRFWNTPIKDTACPKTKKKPQWDGRRGMVMIKSNPIPSRWVTHKLENDNTKESLPLLLRFWTLCQSSHPWDRTVRLGIPIPRIPSDLEGQWSLITGLPEDWKKQRLKSWRAQTKSCTRQDPEQKSSYSTGDWTKTNF